MEIDDFVRFSVLAAIIGFPFGIIYLILSALNWNGRKNIFYNSWLVFTAWLLSVLSMIGLHAVIDINFHFSGALVFAVFIPSLVTVNICAVAAVLYLKSRPKNPVSLTKLDAEDVPPNIGKIWKTAALISILTFLTVIGLIVAIADILEKISQKDPESISFGIYDT